MYQQHTGTAYLHSHIGTDETSAQLETQMQTHTWKGDGEPSGRGCKGWPRPKVTLAPSAALPCILDSSDPALYCASRLRCKSLHVVVPSCLASPSVCWGG